MDSEIRAVGSRPRAWQVSALVLLAGLVAFQRLGRAPVYIDDEAREGVYARAMLATDDFVLPMVPYHLENGLPVPDKPPLFHWIAIAGVHVRELLQTGRWLTPAESAANFDDAALRLPSALAACVMVLGVATLGASLVGKRGALLAGLVLITSLQFVHQARFGRVDMVFATGMCLAMLAAGRAMIEASRRWLWIAGAFLGLATLGKGPMSFVLFGAACLAFAAVQWRRSVPWRSTLALPWITAMMIAIAIALPWYAAALRRAGNMLLQSHVVAEQIQQFKGSNAASSVFTYVDGFFAISPLWCLVTLAALWSLLRVWRRGSNPPGGAGFCAVWLVVFVGLFQMSAFRRRHYLLPVLPAMALLAGWYLDTRLPSRLPQSIKQWFAGIGAWWWGVALAAGSIAAYEVNLAIPRWIDPAQLAPLDAALGLLGVFVSTAALVITLRAAWQGNGWLTFASLVSALAAIYVLSLASGEIAASTQLSPVPVVRRVESALPEGASVKVAGVRNDLTLLLQYYAKHPERWLVEHVKRNAPRAERAPGYYLFTEPEWALERARTGWSERATATFYDRDHPVPLTLAQLAGP